MQEPDVNDKSSGLNSTPSTPKNQPVSPTTKTSSRISSQETDPLELHKLSLSYDYLMFKIKDYIKTLTDQTYDSVLQKHDYIKHDYFERQLNLPQQYKEIDKLLKTCDDIEQEFMKIDQLEMFVNDFKQRLDVIERGFGKKS